MHQTGSFLRSIIEAVRDLVDDPSVDSAIDNSALIRKKIGPMYTEIMALIRMQGDSPFLESLPLAIKANTERYILPPCVQEIHMIVKLSRGYVTAYAPPRHYVDPRGANWFVSGNELRIQPHPAADDDWTIIYSPSAHINPHVATGTVINSTTFEFAAAPTEGILDRQENAYAGSMLNLIHATRNHQRRVIIAYNPATRRATLSTPLNQDATNGLPDSTSTDYEVLPSTLTHLHRAVACRCAMLIAAEREYSGSKIRLLETEFARALKAVTDMKNAVVIPLPAALARHTHQNNGYYQADSVVLPDNTSHLFYNAH